MDEDELTIAEEEAIEEESEGLELELERKIYHEENV